MIKAIIIIVSSTKIRELLCFALLLSKSVTRHYAPLHCIILSKPQYKKSVYAFQESTTQWRRNSYMLTVYIDDQRPMDQLWLARTRKYHYCRQQPPLICFGQQLQTLLVKRYSRRKPHGENKFVHKPVQICITILIWTWVRIREEKNLSKSQYKIFIYSSQESTTQWRWNGVEIPIFGLCPENNIIADNSPWKKSGPNWRMRHQH